MNSNQIELAAVTEIANAFVHCKKIETNIPIKDKEPVWDGFLTICPCKGTYYRIPTQVKGKTVRKLSLKPAFPLSLTNLNNYKRDGGIILFIVFLIGEKKYPYYHKLAPIDLKRFIKLAGKQKQIAVPLYELGEITEERENEFIEFYFDCKRQTSFSNSAVLTLEETIKKRYPITFHGVANSVDISLQSVARSKYLYANINDAQNPIYYPIGDEPYEILFLKTINEPIKVGDTVFFDSYQKELKDSKQTIIIDDFMTITTKISEKKSCCTVSLNTHSLKRYIRQVQFLQSAFNDGYFYIGDIRIETSNQLPSDNITNINKRFEFWSRVVKTFTYLNVDLNLIDITDINEKDINNLTLLCRLILDKEAVSQPQDISPATVLEFGEYSVFLWTEKQKDGKFKGSDFFAHLDSFCLMYKSKGKKVILPLYSAVFKRDDFHKFINIDYAHIVTAYKKICQYNPDITPQANQDVLHMISGYDRQERKDKRLLTGALSLIDWIIEINKEADDFYIFALNRLQILKRLNKKLSDSEKKTLIELSETNIPNNAKWAANILLDDISRAKIYWDLMTEEEKESQKTYPIYYLAKGLQCDDNELTTSTKP